jgi:hypothetical protein
MRNACKILFRKTVGKRSLERPMHRSDANIKMDVTETGYEGMD